MKSTYDEKYENWDHIFEIDDSFSVFGGEIDTDDLNVDEYGIETDNMTIYQIPSTEFKKLAIEMVNHLILNGHSFYFIEQDGIPLLKTI